MSDTRGSRSRDRWKIVRSHSPCPDFLVLVLVGNSFRSFATVHVREFAVWKIGFVMWSFLNARECSAKRLSL